jgi:hypothetical protein
MADSDSSFKSMAWSSVLLGVVLALAHLAWFSLNSDRATVDAGYVVLAGLAVLGWSLVVACGVLGLVTGRPPRPGLPGVAAVSAALAAAIALVLLALTASGGYGDEAFNDVLLQSWPLLPLLLFAGDWVRRSRVVSASPV